MTASSKCRLAWQLLFGTVLSLGLTSGAAQADKISGPYVSAPAVAHPTPALSSLPPAKEPAPPIYIRPRHNPLANEPDHGLRGTGGTSAKAGPTAEGERTTIRATPAPLLTFEGQSNTCACSPPDTVGDVGPNHYVQMVNATKIAIYNKSGTLLAGYPKDMSSLWTGVAGACDASNSGDPVVMYDSLADRWLLAQFQENFQNGICVAVSKTGDPTGAYWLYEFSTGAEFPDYIKFGVWPDGYYMSSNETNYAAYAFDRAKMLAGLPATFQRFAGVSNFMLPSDVDGTRAPPAGAPNYFYTFKDDTFHGGADRLEVFSFHADWVTPGNSTFTLADTINISAFEYTVCGFFVLNCIPQSGTVKKLDPVSEWPMFRFPYRNFGDHQSAAGTFTVDAGGNTAGIRWFELRKTTGGWTLFQEGTHAPDANHRWMGSIAMDGAGNLALGYSVSSASMFPAIRYAVHRIGDALGTMQTEAVLRSGGGSQTGSNRWGDYSAMSIDPANDAKFWFTSEYYPSSSAKTWHTRIGTFRILQTATFRSAAANDGYITESSETSGSGGATDASSLALRAGDDAADRQFRDILDFDTSSLPDAAVVTKVALRVKQRGSITGGNPFDTLGTIRADIKNGALNGNSALEPADFEAADSLASAAIISNRPVGGWFWAFMKSTAHALINKTGHTQVRLRFLTDDNDNGVADYIEFDSGNEADITRRPRLVVTYYVP